mgnify:FL=1
MTNIVILSGNVGQDPETNTYDRTQVTRFSMATSRPRYSDGEIVRDKDGRAEQETEWHRVVAFNGLAKSLRKCVKGMRVLVVGRNKTTKWTDKDGATHYTTEVVAERIEFLSWPKPKGENDEGSFNGDDDIPF